MTAKTKDKPRAERPDMSQEKSQEKSQETKPKTIRDPFILIDRRVARDPELPANLKALYLVLKSYSWQDGNCFPSQETLAGDLNFSERTIRTWLKDLESYGLVKIVKQGKNQPNIYYLRDLDLIYRKRDRKVQASKTDRKTYPRGTGNQFPPTNKQLTNNQYIYQPEAENQNQGEPAEAGIEPAVPQESVGSTKATARPRASEAGQEAEIEPAAKPQAKPKGLLLDSQDRRITKARKQSGKRGYSYPVQYDEFWQAYPRPTGKRPAYLRWEKLVIDQKTPPEEILEAAANYKDLCQFEGRRKKFMLHPRTFLGPADHWVDYLTEELKASGQLETLKAARKRNQGQAGQGAGQWSAKAAGSSASSAGTRGASRSNESYSGSNRSRAESSGLGLPPVRAMPADLAREIDQELIELIKRKNQGELKDQSQSKKGQN